METFEAPKAEQYLSVRDGDVVRLRFVKRLDDHGEFKLRSDPAPIYRVEDQDLQTYRWTITSAQLADTLELVRQKTGDLIGTWVEVQVHGEGTDRRYVLGLPVQEDKNSKLVRNDPPEVTA